MGRPEAEEEEEEEEGMWDILHIATSSPKIGEERKFIPPPPAPGKKVSTPHLLNFPWFCIIFHAQPPPAAYTPPPLFPRGIL